MTNEYIKKICILKIDYHSAFKREGHPAICNNTDEPGGRYAKWSVSHGRTVLHDSSYMRNLQQSNSWTHRSARVVQRGWGKEVTGSSCSKGVCTCSRIGQSWSCSV